MPVFWYALSQTADADTTDTLLIFVILHMLVYPASNGYNSYMDRDTGSIGGIEKPLQPTKQLYYVTIALDTLAISLGLLISIYFTIALAGYILASRAYSYRGIRLKRYPVWGYVTVIIFQGAVTYFMVAHGCSENKTLQVPAMGMLAASLLIGGFYPLTQIYQHQQDKADGVITLSMLLGYKGSFLFTGFIYLLAVAALGIHLVSSLQSTGFIVIQIFLLPVLVYFLWWFRKVMIEHTAANFVNTMRMNILASFCSNAAFICLYLIEKF
jgi:1,4-dihydroxy-2-naphthoate polyprenyltransferase